MIESSYRAIWPMFHGHPPRPLCQRCTKYATGSIRTREYGREVMCAWCGTTMERCDKRARFHSWYPQPVRRRWWRRLLDWIRHDDAR